MCIWMAKILQSTMTGECVPSGKNVQMVFQDPYASLNPRMSVFDIIAEPLLVHHLYQDKADLEKKVLDLLHRVGLDDYHANRYPHEFFRRSASENRNCPCTCGRTVSDHRRRTGFGTGCVYSGAGSESFK